MPIEDFPIRLSSADHEYVPDEDLFGCVDKTEGYKVDEI